MITRGQLEQIAVKFFPDLSGAALKEWIKDTLAKIRAERESSPYYNSDQIDELDAVYNLIYGPRSNGKTFEYCRKSIDAYLGEDLPSAYVRRLDEMIKPSNIQDLFNPHLDYIQEMTNGEYNSVVYRSRCFYLARYEDGVKVKQDKNPFCRTYAINTAETTKGQDSGAIKYIIFDEFITRQFYLSNEFILFQNLISSLCRSRDNIKIIMIANSVSKYCPYFREMGLTRVKDQKQGTIDLYKMGKSETKIAVEYCSESAVAAKVSQYYCFENPELEMITSGAWEIALYRHIPKGVGDVPPELTFYVIFDDITLRCGLYIFKDSPLITVSRRYKEIKDPENCIIYADDLDDPPDPNPLHQTNLAMTPTRAHELILRLIKQHKTFFDTNEDGETFGSWLKWATKGALKV